jgi:hypothetical protein
MPTKPEGPAQEPCDRCNGTEWEQGFSGYPTPCRKCCVPATPAPSQPAGAREWLLAHRDEMFALACAFDEARLAELMDAFLAERIAALTDKLCRMQDDIATIVSTHRADWSWNDVVADVKGLAAQTAAKDAALEAAERERDSLREVANKMQEAWASRQINYEHEVVALDFGAAQLIEDTLAALKAGKEG